MPCANSIQLVVDSSNTMFRMSLCPSGFSWESLSSLINDVKKRSRWGDTEPMHFPPLSSVLSLNDQQKGGAIKYGRLFLLSNGILTPITKKYNFFVLNFKMPLFTRQKGHWKIERSSNFSHTILKNVFSIDIQLNKTLLWNYESLTI